MPIRFAEFGRYHLPDEFMPRRTGETVVAALEFQVRVADSPCQQANQREAPFPIRLAVRLRRVADFDDAGVEMHGEHEVILRLWAQSDADHRARRLAHNPVSLRAQIAGESIHHPTAYDNQVGVQFLRSLVHHL